MLGTQSHVLILLVLILLSTQSLVLILPWNDAVMLLLHLLLQVLEWSGSVLDVLSLAVRAALHNTRIPRLTVTGEGEEMEVEVSDNPHDSTPINITHAPIIITLTQVTQLCKVFKLLISTIYICSHF